MSIKFLKYHHKWAWGNTQPEFTLLGDASDVDKCLIEDVCEGIIDAHSYSNKYRGIDYDVIDISDLNKEEKAMLFKEYTDKIKRFTNSIKHFREMKGLLK